MLYRKELDELGSFSVYRGKCKAKMDQNESPYKIPEDLKEKIFQRIKNKSLNRYTKPEDFKKLKNKLAKYNNIDINKIAIGAGADTLIHTIVEAFSINQGKSLMFYPSYPIYNLFSKINGVDCLKSKLNKKDFSINKNDFENKVKKSKTIFITYPNNPTGNLYNKEYLLKIIDKYPKKLFVIDEAYFEFSEESFKDYLSKYKNIIILRTFSKFFSIPSLRLGYMMANSDVVKIIEKCQFMPYNVSIFSLCSGIVFLENVDYFKNNKDKILTEKKRVIEEVNKLKSFKLYESDTNFVFIKEKNNEKIADYLSENKIFVRDFSEKKGLNGFFRITIGDKKENNRLIKYLKKWDG